METFLYIGKNEYDLKVNEVFGVGGGYFSDFYTKKYTGLRLETGDKIELSGGLTVLFQAK